MVSADNQFQDLLALTEGKSDFDRTLLYRHVAHLIVQRRDSEDFKEQFLLIELYDELAKQVDENVRAELSRDISHMEEPPIDLAARLARDKIFIAGPVLKNVPFNEKALLDIIRDTARSHHLVITERPDLSQKVWQAIRTAKEAEEGISPKQKPAFSLKAIPSTQKKHEGAGLFVRDIEDPLFSLQDNDYSSIKPPKEKTLLTPKADPVDASWSWATKENGKLLELSENARYAFGQPSSSLLGQYFPVMATNTKEGQDLFLAMRQNQPLRDMEVKIKDSLGTESLWLIMGKAQFDYGSGKFKGYKGVAKPTVPIFERQQPRETSGPEMVTLTGLLADQIISDTEAPLVDIMETMDRLGRNARRTNDQGLLSDIQSLQDDLYSLRDIVETGKRISNLFGGRTKPPIEAFDIFKVTNIALDEDTRRHGGMPKFNIRTNIKTSTARFNKDLIKSGLLSGFELARKFDKSFDTLNLVLNYRKNKDLALILPMGKGDKGLFEEDVLLEPDYQIRHKKYYGPNEGKTVLDPAMNLAGLRQPFEALGGQILIKQNSEGHKYLILSVPIIKR